MKRIFCFSLLLLLMRSIARALDISVNTIQIKEPLIIGVKGATFTIDRNKLEFYTDQQQASIKWFLNEYANKLEESENKYFIDYSILTDCDLSRKVATAKPSIDAFKLNAFNKNEKTIQSINLELADIIPQEKMTYYTSNCLNRKAKVKELLEVSNSHFSALLKSHSEILDYKSKLKEAETNLRKQEAKLSDYVQMHNAANAYKNLTTSIIVTSNELVNSTEKSKNELSEIINKAEIKYLRMGAEINSTNASIRSLHNDLKQIFQSKLEVLGSIDKEYSKINLNQLELNELDDNISLLNQTTLQYSIEIKILEDRLDEVNRKIEAKKETLADLESKLNSNIIRLAALNKELGISKSSIKSVNEEVAEVNSQIQGLQGRKQELQKSAYEILKDQEKSSEEISYLKTQNELLRTEKRLLILDKSRIEKIALSTNSELQQSNTEIERLTSLTSQKVNLKKSKLEQLAKMMIEKENSVVLENQLDIQIDSVKSTMEKLKAEVTEKAKILEINKDELATHTKHLKRNDEVLINLKSKQLTGELKLTHIIDEYESFKQTINESQTKFAELKDKLALLNRSSKSVKAKLLESFEILVGELPIYSRYVSWISILINEDLSKLVVPLFS